MLIFFSVYLDCFGPLMIKTSNQAKSLENV